MKTAVQPAALPRVPEIKPRPRRSRFESTLPYLIVGPSLLILIGILYPFGIAVWTSFTSQRLSTAARGGQYVGLANYVDLLSGREFWLSLQVTLVYAVAVVVIELVLGFAIAMMLNQRIRGISLARALVLLPLMIPPVAGALMWKVMMAPIQGVLNHLLSFIGIRGFPWLGGADTAMFSVILIDAWIFTPFIALILLAGLQSLPKEPYEASLVDGASAWFTFRRLTLPLLRPLILLAVAFRLTDSLRQFDVIFATTKGGPADLTMNLHLRTYYYAFRWDFYGVSSTYGIILWAIVFVAVQILIIYWQRAIRRAAGEVA